MNEGTGVNKGFTKCEADDPGRCQSAGGFGQCPFLSVNGTTHCPRHGGTKGIENKVKSMYRLMQWQGRVDEFAGEEGIKSLRDEIGITRMMLEAIVQKCSDGNDMVMQSSKISSMVMSIEKLVSSCHRLEASSGQLLDKSSAINLASQIVVIIGNHIEDADVIDRISADIVLAIAAEAK